MFKKVVAFLLGLAFAVLCFGPEKWIHRPLVSLVITTPAPKAPECPPAPAPRFTPADVVVGSVMVIPEQVIHPMKLSDGGIEAAPIETRPERRVQRFGIVGDLFPSTEAQLLVYLEAAENVGVTDIELLIHSGGGNVISGFHMASLLHSAKPVVHCFVSEAAESSAFLLLQGCDDRAALPTSKLMEHRPFLFVPGDSEYSAEALKEHASELIEERQLMVEILASRSLAKLGAEGLSEDEIARRLSQGDWVMTSAEAVAFGLLDRVVADAETFKYSIEN